MKKNIFMILLLALLSACANRTPRTVIVLPREASDPETLAAKEVRRYVYQRSGQLLPIVRADTLMAETEVILVARKERPIIATLADENVKQSASKLGNEEYLLKTTTQAGRRVAVLCGGDDVGTLYAAYRFAEHLGVRFELHGDVIPDEKIRFRLPKPDETRTPLFPVRGIQPFHDFPEGPDWWSADDYKAVLSQLPKLGMNFIGFHTYPEGGVGPEPTVWIGATKDLRPNGDVSFSYPARHFTTLNGTWGYEAKKTSDYSFGADQLFARDAYGADYMKGMAPWPGSPEESNALFNRSGDFFEDVFSYAKKLGVKTCVGTETPLVIPGAVRERLQRQGKNPDDWKTVQSLYEGMFQWVKKNYPIDYYWLWTPENWTWGGNSEQDILNVRRDLDAAIAAAKNVSAPFRLAACGWVLGPKKDRAMFDEFLPKEMPMSSINRQVGFAPVDVNFARLKDRPRWAIPWMEDDPAMILPQLWAGRMRRDAADALAYGCTGLLGIHWRTRILGPNVAALAAAAWEQEEWNPNVGKPFQPPDVNRIEGSPGALFAVFSDTTLGHSPEDSVYRTLIYSMDNYYLNLDDGVYDVTLKFLEVHYKQSNKRYFGVKIQDKTVADRLDIFARAGYGRPLDVTFKNIAVHGGRLHLQFKKISDNAILAGIVVARHAQNGPEIVRKINCAGRAVGDYEADPSIALQGYDRPRDMPVRDFYADWARAQFGSEAAPPLAGLFERLDGSSAVKTIGQRQANLPRPSDWRKGPGGVFPDPRPWEEVRREYAFVDEMERLRPKVRGAGNLERFDFWLNQFRYLRAVGQFRCTLHRFNEAMRRVRAEQNADVRKKLAVETVLPVRVQQMEELREIHKYLLNSISTTGGMGTLTNWQQHNIPMLIEKPGKELETILGEDLPAAAQPSKAWPGEVRLIVPTVRTTLAAGEPLTLKVILVGAPETEADLYWRPLGADAFQESALAHTARGVYGVTLPREKIPGDFEYYIRVKTANGETLTFPASAPALNRTVVIMANDF